mmetsp:Transcript_31600/g.75757  ORF Transcript_31600/g.75757 Transcript_31600/m.75757 type:complete len:382 (+) Transcript_31600:29-1174(+)
MWGIEARAVRVVPALRTSVRWRGKDMSRRFLQRMNEAHLAHTLQEVSDSMDQGRVVTRDFNPPPVPKAPKRNRTIRQAMEESVQRFGQTEAGAQDADFDLTRKRPFKEDYESLSSTSEFKYQDLLHPEARRMQELVERKRLVNKRILWMKQSGVEDPSRKAKAKVKQEQYEKKAELEDAEMYPPRYMVRPQEIEKSEALVQEQRFLELESQYRAKLREERLVQNKVLKAKQPSVAGITLDPWKKQAQRRRVRIGALMQAHIENIMTQNTAQILYQMLDGASISIVDVKSESKNSRHYVYYTVSGSTHSLEWVQKQLDVLAPKIRSQLALSLNLAQTPELAFRPAEDLVKTYDRPRLWRLAEQVRKQRATALQEAWTREMNW